MTRYLLDNGLLTQNELHDLLETARAGAAEGSKRDQAKINELFGEFQSICQNRTKRDPTADKALKKV